MNTHDKIELPEHDCLYESTNEQGYIDLEPAYRKSTVLRLLEADRKRRGEPVLVGWAVGTTGGGLLHANKYTEHEARDAGYSLPLYRLTAPQPAEPSGAPTLHNADSGAQSGIQATQTAEPVKCQDTSMGEHACSNRAQCWEPCGELGSSIEHAKVAEPVKVPVIEPSDLRVDTYPAEPHSAWIVKADTGVRVTHVPTGLSAACHEDRSVHRNRALAMEKLQKMLQTHEPVKVDAKASVPSDLRNAVCDLISTWREQQSEYPAEGKLAAAAVRLCANELEDLLARYANQENSNG